MLLGFGLAHIPGVAAFAARYIDLVLIGIVVVSVVPILIKTVAARLQTSRVKFFRLTLSK